MAKARGLSTVSLAAAMLFALSSWQAVLCKSRKLSRLEEWAWQGGARFPSVEVFENDDGSRGLRATQQIKKGEPIIVVPGTLAFVSTRLEKELALHLALTGQDKERYRKASLDEIGDTERLMLMLITVLCNPYSKWRPFIRGLPRMESLNLPWYHWPEGLREGLKGSPAWHYAHHLQKWFEVANKNVCRAAQIIGCKALEAVSCDRELAAWSFMIVRTRSFDCPDGNGALLLPLADMVNHDPGSPSFFLPFSSGTGYGGLVAESDIGRGEEIFACYEQSSNANLLANYGFIVDRNRYNSVQIPQVRCNGSHVDHKPDSVVRSSSFMVSTEGVPSASLMTVLMDCCAKSGHSNESVLRNCASNKLAEVIDNLLGGYKNLSDFKSFGQMWYPAIRQLTSLVQEEKAILGAAKQRAFAIGD